MSGLRTGFGVAITRSGIVRGALGVALVMLVLTLCLFGECQTVRNSPALGSILGEAAAVLSDSGTQWMVFLCAVIYLLAFAILRRHLAGEGRTRSPCSAPLPCELWLVGVLAVAVLAYVFDYARAVKSTHALTLLGGAVLGQGAAVWAGWGNRSLKSKVQCPKSEGRSRRAEG